MDRDRTGLIRLIQKTCQKIQYVIQYVNENSKLHSTMTMHLVRGMTTTGRRKGKSKFSSSDAKHKQAELAAEWERKQAEWAKMSPASSLKPSTSTYTPPRIPENRDTMRNAVRVDSGVTGAVTVKQTQHYTGDRLIGISIMHKSCLQPVFSEEQARDAASMRR